MLQVVRVEGTVFLSDGTNYGFDFSNDGSGLPEGGIDSGAPQVALEFVQDMQEAVYEEMGVDPDAEA